MHLKIPGLLTCGLAALTLGQVAGADNFNRIATFANYINNADSGDETVSEIVSVNAAGTLLVYTDSPGEQIGFVDITNATLPQAAGTFALTGEPTAVAVLGNDYALVGVNTSTSFASPSGFLAVIDISPLPATLVRTIDLGGQPDSVAISPDGQYAAVAIENERDEDVNDGELPQLPAGYLAVIDLADPDPLNWTRADVDLTGFAAYAPTDPEPEFVDINADNHALVTLQENNHIAIVDLATLSVVTHFSAGAVDLDDVDATEDGVIVLADDLNDVPREPDSGVWVSAPSVTGGYAIATANEGDLFGGSRGATVFDPNTGSVIYDSGSSYDEAAVRVGHYPEDRSENKGSEPEGADFAPFGGTNYLFVASERGSFVGVYTVAANGVPALVQVLPGPLGPEGLLAIPSRNLLVASGEEDDPTFGVRSTMMIYELQDADPVYPHIQSASDGSGKPIGWSALSGMTTDPDDGDQLLAVWDSYYSQSQIFTIDTTQTPAVITEALPILGGSGDFDPEGIVVAPDDTIWVASEGNATGSRPNRLLQLDTLGAVIDEIFLPQRVENCRSKSSATGTLGSGFEGLTVVEEAIPGIASPGRSGTYYLLVAQQRGWNYTSPGCQGIDDDPLDLNGNEPGFTRIWTYDVKRGLWAHIVYTLESKPANASWVGLSEITRVDGGFIVIERDNRTGDWGVLKTLVYFNDAAIADGVVTRAEKSTYDLIPDLDATNGWITDKPEGVALTDNGDLYVVTDNDGVEDWSGETWFLNLGPWQDLFGLN